MGIFRPRRMGHVNFWVHGHERTAQFYRDIVGVDEVYRREAIKAIFMSNGNTYHDVAFMDLSSPRGAGHQVGMHHFALELETEADLVEGYKACDAAGFKFDFMISADVTNSCYGSDPDGNRFEVYADVVENWREQRKGLVTTGGKPYVPGATPPITKHLYPVGPEIVVLKDAVFHPRRASHVVLVTRAFEAMVRHYTELVGLRPIAGRADGDFIVLGGSVGEETLALFRDTGLGKSGLHHFGMELPSEDELERSRSLMAKHDLKPAAEIDHPTRRCLFVKDCSGLLIQFYVNRKTDYASWSSLKAAEALMLA